MVVSWGKWRKIEWRPFIRKVWDGECWNHQSAPPSPRENKYTINYLCIYEVAVLLRSRFSCYKKNGSREAWGAVGRVSIRNTGLVWLPGQTAGWMGGWLMGPASLCLCDLDVDVLNESNWYHCFMEGAEGEWESTIEFFHWKCQPTRWGTVRLGRAELLS